MPDAPEPDAPEPDARVPGTAGEPAAAGAGGSPRPDTRDPHGSRLTAVKLLFQADLRDRDPGGWLERVDQDPEARALLEAVWDDAPERTDGRQVPADLPRLERAARAEPEPIDGYTRRLVAGVADHRERIDDLLGRFSRSWPVHRMALIDRNVLRLGVYELLWEDVGAAVVIDEAVELVKELSTDDSHRFVNGVLEAIREWAAGGDGPAAPGRADPDEPDPPSGGGVS